MVPVASAAPRADVVVLDNGDRLQCEIKELSRGRLSVSTDALDTVRVFWQRVAHVVSPREFEVHVSDGTQHFGALVMSGTRQLRVMSSGIVVADLALDDVVRLLPVEGSLWQRFDGHVDAGFSFVKANLETRWSVASEVQYRARRYEGVIAAASQVVRRSDAERLSRNNLSLGGRRLLPRRWFASVLGQVQTNDELSLRLRAVGGGGVGRSLWQTTAAGLQVLAGGVYTREHFTDLDSTGRGEALLGGNWEWRSLRNNDLDVSVQALSFYGGPAVRVRLEVQAAARVEFLRDFYVSVNGYGSTDSKPPAGRLGSDLGITLSLGRSF